MPIDWMWAVSERVESRLTLEFFRPKQLKKRLQFNEIGRTPRRT